MNALSSCLNYYYFSNEIHKVPTNGLQSSHAIDLRVLENLIHSEQEEIKSFINEQNIRYDFDKKNIHLKYILERDGEYERRNIV